ncbi:MAG: glycerate kinase [Alphaproteobacteria bacterium]|nr:glycerate kinase [Alphaproteobacteria bacterium]
MIADPREFLTGLFRAAIAAAQPALCVPPNLPPPPRGRLIVVGAGKASAAMAAAAEAQYAAHRDVVGLVVTRDGHGVPCRRIEIVEAAHPVPDARAPEAAARMLALAGGAGPDDLVLALMSGGGSALLALPQPPVTMAEFRALTTALLKSGANIHEMNAVRKHLSLIAGGRLAAAAAPAPMVTLAISDVPGDDPSTIGSGPTVADPTTLADARAVLAKYAIAPAASIAARLADAGNETPKPGDRLFASTRFVMAASPRQALEVAIAKARAAGLAVHSLGDAVEGESRDVARDQAALALSIAAGTGPVRPPCVLVSGGETTVTVRGQGRGGRNAEFLLALALALKGHPRIHAIAGDTDGIDGIESSAGATLAPDSLVRLAAAGVDAAARLADNDAWTVFDRLGDLVVTGPTLTNVNDFRAMLII